MEESRERGAGVENRCAKEGGRGKKKGCKVKWGESEMLFGMVTSNTREKISAFIEFPRSIGPDKRREGESHDMLGFFRQCLEIRTAKFAFVSHEINDGPVSTFYKDAGGIECEIMFGSKEKSMRRPTGFGMRRVRARVKWSAQRVRVLRIPNVNRGMLRKR